MDKEVTEAQIRESWANLAKSSSVILEGKTDEDYLRLHVSVNPSVSPIYYRFVERLAKRLGVRDALVQYGISYDWEKHKKNNPRYMTYHLSFRDEQSAARFIFGVNGDENLRYTARVPEKPQLCATFKLRERLS